ncbi:thioesterase family protein [Amycolatopsis sp. K13G38]|uniref:Thioesterase family protein n=1 Tax=Amycolatopsis acididurans TaxID=2724524 RepID=A0ABX1J771_9PSEU|nr:acyl-CoA thioesterase domain-containing protein [Amycolatopsis acididurans]NKQ55514.1 thioesterase family protein [Amycolatopsis acididurans]
MNHAYFEVAPGAGDTLVPRPSAGSLWGGGTGQMRGSAVSGALARAVERAVPPGPDGVSRRPVRWRVDLFRPAAMAPCMAEATVVRAGRQLCLVDAVLRQDGRAVARAGAAFLTEAAAPEGKVFSPRLDFVPPPPGMRPGTTEDRLYYSETVGWTPLPDPHQNEHRKQIWLAPVRLVAGEEGTAFQFTAMATDVVNMVANWGALGVEFINADASLVMSRLPAPGEGLGLAAEHRFAEAGIATGTAVMFDRAGAFGAVTVSAVASPGGAIDPRLIGVRR